MGPLKKMSVKGNKIILEFTNQGKKLVMGTSPYIPAGKPPHSETDEADRLPALRERTVSLYGRMR